ncbi:glycosyltransferase family 4 protein [Actinomycetospora endophytica]|uniref:Glycosyltransferase family 4 protein n=1 Tax=Actinomycetospora endophytica TaxID=2291215 RepID=A0ABS8P2A0_9PSEU|nr:glycosyltransferase family 4 protein [Actinomycetospora endophytica]MCD2192366.1 glycosyltransferase family 4 protein [Actinomycetospora endophytica]
MTSLVSSDRHTHDGPMAIPVLGRSTAQLAGCRVLLLNWRDVRHSQAGGAELYAHEISKRWVEAGVHVTWLTARDAGQSAHDEIDGVEIRRAGATMSVYARAAMRLLRGSLHQEFDAVVDCQNGIPFFSPLFTRNTAPTVQVVHHVHQDQFATRFSPTGAAVGRFLEGRVARRVYSGKRTVAVSASTRQELRRRLKFDGPIDVVPNGMKQDLRTGPTGTRAEKPTIVLTSRLVPHKRVDLLLHAVWAALPDVPDLQVEIIGDGPDLTTLRRTAVELGLGRVVRFHGRLPDAERDALMDQAWLTTSTSDGEGWGLVVLEGAAAGVPCLALRATGIRDSVLDGVTGWLVDGIDDFAAALPRTLAELADPARAEQVSRACRDWAACFTWDRSAELLAGSVLSEMRAFHRTDGADSPLPPADRSALHRAATRRKARSDMTTLARFTHDRPWDAAAALRLTDEASVRVLDGPQSQGPGEVVALLRGCDEVDALAVLGRIGAQEPHVRLASRHELLGGPAVFGVGGPAGAAPAGSAAASGQR